MRTSIARLVLLSLVLAGCDLQPPADIPEFDTSTAEPQVAERLRALREVVEVHRDSAPAWGLLALSLQVHGYTNAAIEAYAEARSLRPNTFAYLYMPGILLADRGDDRARHLLAEAHMLRPIYVPLLLREAALELDLGQPDRVLDLLEDDVVLSTAPARGRLIIARAVLALGQQDRARALVDAGIESAPSYGDLHAFSAELYRRSGDTALARIADIRAQVFRDEPTIEDPVLATLYAEGISSRWHILRGQSYRLAGRLEDSRIAFESAVAAQPDDSHGWNQLGITLQALGRFDEAAEAHMRALQLRPGFAETTSNLAMSLFSAGKLAEGLDAARQAIEIDAAAPKGYLYLGMFQQAIGQPDRARNTYFLGLASGTFDIRIGIRLSWILATSRASSIRNGREAVELAETVNEIEGYIQPASLDALAAAYAEYGDFNRALVTAGRARELAVRQADDVLAEAIERRGNLYAQRRAYRE